MIETVQERQRGAFNFESYYDNLCALQDTCPIPAVKAHLADGVLDINGDRIRQQDWQPIFCSIKINKSLRFVAFRSYFQLNLENGMPEKKAKIMRSRIPVIRTKEMTASLCKVIRDCLVTTENLECLELQGIYLRDSDLSLIGQGIMKNSTLKHLSFESCRIGDPGLVVLCTALKMAGNISTLNLTGCGLSPIGISALADLIKFQTMSRHNEAWKESLRYRWANFDSMCGVRRITLNRNIGVGDEGANIIAESLKDDLWVKAIDLQECSLTNDAVRVFLKVLKYNSTLVVLDLRRNPMIDRDLLRSVTEQVLINGDGKETEYKWLRVEDLIRSNEENFERHPRSYYNGPSKPLDFKCRPAFKPAGRVRSKSAGSLDRKGYTSDVPIHSRDGSALSSARGLNVQAKGQPWRTAARANRYKGYPPDHVPGKSNLEEQYEEFGTPRERDYKVKATEPSNGHQQIKPKLNDKVKSQNDGLSNRDDENSTSIVLPLVMNSNQHPPIPDSLKELKTEIFHLRTQLDKYKTDKAVTEEKLNEIYGENKRLRNTIKLISKTNAAISSKNHKTAILQNEAILETIENSFQKFNAFLDMLRQSGLGKVVTAAGMDNFASTSAILNRIDVHKSPDSDNGLRTTDDKIPVREIEQNSKNSSKKSVSDEAAAIYSVSDNDEGQMHHLQQFPTKMSSTDHHRTPGNEINVSRQRSFENEFGSHKENGEDVDLHSVGWRSHNNFPKSDVKLRDETIFGADRASKQLNERSNIVEEVDPADTQLNQLKFYKPTMSPSESISIIDDEVIDTKSSTTSVATHSKVTKATSNAQNEYVEDSTQITDSIENGVLNDSTNNFGYLHQESIEGAQEISFDESNDDD